MSILNSLYNEFKDLWKYKTFTALFIFILLCIIGSCSACFLGDDNLLEEFTEEVIEEETGLKLDLTPGSKEKLNLNLHLFSDEQETRIMVKAGIDF